MSITPIETNIPESYHTNVGDNLLLRKYHLMAAQF